MSIFIPTSNQTTRLPRISHPSPYLFSLPILLPSTSANPTGVPQFQFTWIANEIDSHDLVLLTHLDRVQNAKGIGFAPLNPQLLCCCCCCCCCCCFCVFCCFFWFVSFLTSSSVTRLSRGRVPKTDV